MNDYGLNRYRELCGNSRSVVIFDVPIFTYMLCYVGTPRTINTHYYDICNVMQIVKGFTLISVWVFCVGVMESQVCIHVCM